MLPPCSLQMSLASQRLASRLELSLIYDHCSGPTVSQNTFKRITKLKAKPPLTTRGFIETYAAFCRNYGTHSTTGAGGYRCWNEEALKPMNDYLADPWSRLETELQRQLEITHTSVSETLYRTVASNLGSYHLVPQLLVQPISSKIVATD